MTEKTDNHDLSKPRRGATDWHVPLNENFDRLDRAVEVRDVESKRDEYDPVGGAKFYARDTGAVYVGDGSRWEAVDASGESPTFESVESDGDASVGGDLSVDGAAATAADLDVGGDLAVAGATSATRVSTTEIDAGTLPFRIGVDGEDAVRIEPGESAQDFDVAASVNVIAGHPNNEVGDDVFGATIAGGGDDLRDDYENRVLEPLGTVGGGSNNDVTAASATIAGGGGNVADGIFATVSGGRVNEANGDDATVSGGYSNEANGNDSTIGGGNDNLAAGTRSTVGGGYGNEALATHSTVAGGSGNDALGDYSAVPGGSANTAGGKYALAAGYNATAGHEGSFVWSDSNYNEFSSTGRDQFLIDAAGGVGVGTDAPESRLHVVDEVERNLSRPDGHVATIENASTSTSGDVLALKTGAETPGGANNYVTFLDGDDDAVGAIDGTGNGGVTLRSGSADFGEYFPKADPETSLRPGDVVGLEAGHLTRRTADADAAFVVTDRPIVLGNQPDGDAEGAHAAVALLGQVPVRIRGSVAAGDLLVASGDGDGRAVGIDDADGTDDAAGARPGVGCALEASDGDTVLAFVSPSAGDGRRIVRGDATGAPGTGDGCDRPEPSSEVIERQRDLIEAQRAELAAAEAELATVRSRRVERRPIARSLRTAVRDVCGLIADVAIGGGSTGESTT